MNILHHAGRAWFATPRRDSGDLWAPRAVQPEERVILAHRLDDDDGDSVDGASPNSHKHFFPYMGFCASIWDNVRHHCHHHHHHHHIQKSKSINTEACLIAHWLKLRYGLMMQAILGHAGDFITVWKKEKSTRPHGNPLCFPKNIFCPMWCNWKRMAVLESA